MLAKPLSDITNKTHQKLLTRIQNYSFRGHHVAGVDNKIADALSRLCRMVMKTHNLLIPTPRLLPMSKTASVHYKQL